MKSITYHAPSGQEIRQMQEYGNNIVTIESRRTDYVHKSGVHGSSGFTSEMWNTDLDTLKAHVKEWASAPEKILFRISYE